MNTGIQGYDVSALLIDGLWYYSYSVRLPKPPSGKGSDYLIRFQKEVRAADGSVSLSAPKKVSNVPYAERSCLTRDAERPQVLGIAYQTKDPTNTALVSIATSSSGDLGDHWTR